LIEIALTAVDHFGIKSLSCAKLYQTAKVIRDLRVATQTNKTIEVVGILSRANMLRKKGVLDQVAVNEIEKAFQDAFVSSLMENALLVLNYAEKAEINTAQPVTQGRNSKTIGAGVGEEKYNDSSLYSQTTFTSYDFESVKGMLITIKDSIREHSLQYNTQMQKLVMTFEALVEIRLAISSGVLQKAITVYKKYSQGQSLNFLRVESASNHLTEEYRYFSHLIELELLALRDKVRVLRSNLCGRLVSIDYPLSNTANDTSTSNSSLSKEFPEETGKE
jgi:hypothetical protein